MRRRAARLALAGVACLTLAGCSGLLNRTIETRLVISEQCQQILEDDSRDLQFAPSNLISTRLTNLTNSLNQIRRSEATKSDLLPIASIKDDATKEWNAIAKALDEVSKPAKKIDDTISRAIKTCRDNGPAVLSCLARAWAIEKNPVEAERTNLQNALINLQVLLATSHASLAQRVETEIAATRPLSELQIREYTIWINDVHSQIDSLLPVVSGDVRTWLRETGRNHILRYAAQHGLEQLHRSLRPMDAAFDRADDKSYGLLGGGVFLLSPDIAGAVGEGLDTVVESYRRHLGKNDLMADFLFEMGRAACRNITENAPRSTWTEIVDSALILRTDERMTRNRSCRTPLPEPFGDPANDCRNQVDSSSAQPALKTLLAHKRQSDGSAPRPAPPPAPARKAPDGNDDKAITPAAHTDNASIGGPAPAPEPKDTKDDPDGPRQAYETYLVHESAARRAVLIALANDDLRQRQQTGRRGLPTLPPLSERQFVETAELAAARVIDGALRSGNADLASQKITLPDALLKERASLAAVDAVTRTNPELNPPSASTPPVVTTPPPAQQKPPEVIPPPPKAPLLCLDAQFDSGVYCQPVGEDSVIVLHDYFPTADCYNPTLVRNVEQVGTVIRQWAAKIDRMLEAHIEGYASRQPVTGETCPPAPGNNKGKRGAAAQGAPAPLPDHTTLDHRTLPIQRCEATRGDPGNIRLSAQRASTAARALEEGGRGLIRIESLAALGTHGACLAKGNNNPPEDRMVVIRLRPIILR